jgi:uncharacterized RDD family membrane protein YckC
MERTFEVTEDLLASQGQRLANSILDLIAYYFIVFSLGIIIALIGELTGNPYITDSLNNINGLVDILLSITITSAYFYFFEVFTSATLGKLITKTIVVDQYGDKPDSSQLLKRTLSRLIPFDAFSYLGTPSRGWHDTISNTYVVKKEAFLTAKELFYSLDEIGNDIENNN